VAWTEVLRWKYPGLAWHGVCIGILGRFGLVVDVLRAG
jgi:hypothetical protein